MRWRRITKLSGLLVCYIYWLADQFGIAWLLSPWKCSLVVLASAFLCEWSRLNLSSVFLAVLVIGLTAADYAVGKLRL